jgi:predicted alpha/beta superfamily hydrolase/acetyl esterase/lipase
MTPVLVFLPTTLLAGGIPKAVTFSLTNDVGLGNEVCVLGPHPALGGNDPLKAIKLTWTAGNVWRGQVALPDGETLAYKFIRRSFATSNWPTATATDLTPTNTIQVPDHPAPPWKGKTIFLHSSWNSANLFWRNLTMGETNWTTTPMQWVGAGRPGVSGEKLFRVDAVSSPGSELEFVFNNGAGTWSNAPAPPSGTATGAAPAVPVPYQGLAGPYNFRTRLDVFFVQDGQVFNYRPPPTLSAPQIITTNVGSTVTNIPGRPVTIYLPRGYTQNTWKRYPVVYLHDGQNVFFPGSGFGTWDADRIANHEISQGRMRESILVAIPNGNAYGSDRLYEYLPDGDTITNYAGLGLNFTGRASLYLKWILDNLTPTLDFNFRTYGISPADTLTAGSSMGGLISDYIGSQRPDRFGAVGIFSPAYWAGTNHANRSITNQSVRRYLYMGTAESSGGQSSSNVYWQDCLNAYNRYLGVNEAVNRDLVFEGGAGGAHNEGNWSRRLPSFYAFALDPRLEANPLAAELFPPDLSVQSVDTATGQVNLRLMAFYGYQNRLKASADLQTWSTNELSSAENFWDPVDVPVIGITGNRAFWRVDSTPGGTSTNTSNYNNLLSVTYDSQGGSVVPSGTTSPGGSIAVAPASPTRSGYTLAGWVTNPIGGSTITFPYQHNQSSSFTLYARWASPSGPASVTRNITYATNGGTALQLDAYRPSGAGPFPAIILVHGGGFVSGSRGSGYIADLAAAVQAAGYAAFDISYRLLGANSTGMSAAQEDLKSAINYVVANAGTLEVDTNRLGTGGGSAGAITALLASYGSNRTTFRPRAVVDLWGAMYGDEGSIRAGDPPMIIIHGTTDTTVPYSYATAINDRATSVGVPVTFFSFNGGHTPALSTVIGGISIQQRVLNFLDQNLR